MTKKRILIILVIAFMISSAIPLPDFVRQSNQGVVITSPSQGDILSGVVNIIGTSEITGFEKAELAFSYVSGNLQNWFPISKSFESVEAGLLMAWDTTLITDGEYRLRLRVISEDKSINEFMVSHITIRNYTPTITPQPSATFIFVNPMTTLVKATETREIRPTELPANPLALSPLKMAISVILGILTIFGLILIISIYSHRQR